MTAVSLAEPGVEYFSPESQTLIDLRLLSKSKFENVIPREYKDGVNKFFEANNLPPVRSAFLQTRTVLNVALDSGMFLQICREKLKVAAGEIWEET